MLNAIFIGGRLTRDPEMRATGSGVSVCNFSVAVERDFKNGGEKVTDFFDCTAWRQSAEFVAKYLRKGAQVVVKGRMQSRDWTDKDGNKRRAWNVECDNVWAMDQKRDTASATDGGMAAPVVPVAVGYDPQAFMEIDCEDGQLPF